jgi:hypothetical protein
MSAPGSEADFENRAASPMGDAANLRVKDVFKAFSAGLF